MPQIEAHQAAAETAVVVARNGEPVGIIAIADTLKSDSKPAIAALHAEGIKTAMITGDNAKTARAIADQVGIDEVFAEVLPQDKAEKVRDLQRGGRRVAFVGDGINDAPALVQADLGIAIGTGTDIAIEAGNIVLVKGSPLKIIEALRLSRVTFRTIKQNLFWAFFYNIAAIPLAALGFLNPMIAAGAMAISSVSVVGNSLRIRRHKLVQGRSAWDDERAWGGMMMVRNGAGLAPRHYCPHPRGCGAGQVLCAGGEQQSRRAGGGRGPLPADRHAAQPDDRQRGDERQLGAGHR